MKKSKKVESIGVIGALADGLSPKQRRFIDEYLIDLNASKSAVRAGYSIKNSDKIASQLLGKTRVKLEIEKKIRERAMRTQISADRVLEELAAVGFSNIFDSLRCLTTHNSQKVNLRAVKKLSVKQGKFGLSYKIELFDKVRALFLLGAHLGLWDRRQNNQNGQHFDGLDDLLESVRNLKASK